MKPLTYIEWKVLQWMSKPYIRTATHGFNLDGRGRASFGQVDLTAAACAAALGLKARGLVTSDNYGTHRLNAAGFAMAEAEPEPEWSPPTAPALNAKDYETLDDLAYSTSGKHAGHWAAPIEFGGGNGSHHSASLFKLVRHGFAMTRQRGSQKIQTAADVVPRPRLFKRAKGSRLYQVTENGLAHAEFVRKAK
jgi:hypothetical protein